MNKKNRHHGEIRVRRQLEGTLRGKFHEAMWNRLRPAVRDYVNDNDSWEDLRSLAEEVLEQQREHEQELREKWGLLEKPEEASPGNNSDVTISESSQPSFHIELPEREKKRAGELLTIWMRRAAEHPDVKWFRRERLGDQQLFYEDTMAFISPGLREEITDWELAELARRLERDYGWRRDDAAWFVLTSRPPRLRPLTADVYMRQSMYGPSHCKITLHVAPWVPSEVVERAFVQIRDQVRGGAGPGTVSEKRLGVLRFVEEQRAKSGRRPNFEALLQMWNQEYPHWAYADYRALAKAYREAYREVVNPKYHMPNAERPEA